ncbi:phage head-tail connector protein [Novosphingobium sp. TH158]|uniref:head-tail connector protein n=1 Tax=Novosphingobium sp. TH158 TaxID=2067455 RepID=UPI000C7B964D|nr:phage head-tail connector protein [Novosphingobium sp. TH158]PLK27412.1 hypothetical protein C0V78_11320 [Novosphingobium sp. TH158]
MKRVIVAQSTLAPQALAELKEWLGITTAQEDATLAALILAALESCEGFTGTLPIECECEELLPVSSQWMRIESRPVHAITAVEAIPADGPRVTLETGAYAIEFAADGAGLVRIVDPGLATRVAVRFTAGLAPDWTALPDGLRHSVVRLAAYHYRQREGDAGQAHPPAAVAALWRPWRRLRLA